MEQSHSFPGLRRPQTAGPSPKWGLRGGREVEICKMSVGGEERRFVWGRGPGHWSAPGPPAAPRMLPFPGEGQACRPKASPRVPAAPLQPLCPLCPGLGDPGPWGRPASAGTGLVGRPPQASACFSTGRSGAPMSWRPCPVPWPGWSWGLGSASPGAPPWTSSRTLGVGGGPLLEGLSGGSHTRSAWPPPFDQSLCLVTTHIPLSVPRSAVVWGPGPLLRATPGGGEGPKHEDPEGLWVARWACWAGQWGPRQLGLEQGSQGAGLQA